MKNDPNGASAEGLPTRRRFLTGLATATLAASSASAAVAVQRTVADFAPQETAEQRAARAWSAFCEAMRDVTAEADGWAIEGAGEQWAPSHPHEKPGPFLRLVSIHYEAGPAGDRRFAKQHRQEIRL